MTQQRRSMHHILTWLGVAWALPLTLAGAVLLALPILLAGGSCRRVDGALPAWLIRGRLGDYLLQRHPVGALNAMAIGHLVIGQQSRISHRILLHELEHVRQAARWGMLFPLVYLAASGWALLRRRNAYWDNVFEIAARRAENRKQGSL